MFLIDTILLDELLHRSLIDHARITDSNRFVVVQDLRSFESVIRQVDKSLFQKGIISRD